MTVNRIGVDLSLACSGLCVNGSTTRIRTKPSQPSRVEHILREIDCFISEKATGGTVNIWVIEGLAFHSGRLGALAELHGAFKFWLNNCSAFPGELYVCAPATLKLYAAGKGNAKKPELAKALEATLGSQAVGMMNHDEVDAWWLHDMAAKHLTRPENMPAHQLQCLRKVFTRERGAAESRRGTSRTRRNAAKSRRDSDSH